MRHLATNKPGSLQHAGILRYTSLKIRSSMKYQCVRLFVKKKGYLNQKINNKCKKIVKLCINPRYLSAI